MKNKISLDQAKIIAKKVLSSAVDMPDLLNKETIVLDNFIIYEKRFWVFFWDPGEIEIQNIFALRSGLSCFVNDRGEVRTSYDKRRTPQDLDECIAGMTKWAERPE
ncbi:hypothetical protein HW509_14205 [Asaia spathodeae]|uniref:hypothetical protein n=1 Tax=Asaia spathodeae TaxID=657016 RepID=UPI002FC3A5B5